MSIYSYFPGCTLKNKAQELDECARLSAEALGFTLVELPEWQCCGGVYTAAKDEIVTKLSAIRALAAARDAGQDLVTICSACHNVIKRANADMQDKDFDFKVNNYLKLDRPYHGETHVYHYLEVLRDKVGFDKLASMVKRPLTGMKVGAYYGCLLLRPGKVMQFDDPENPKIMEDFIRALGAEPVVWSMRNECCGGYVRLDEPKIAWDKSGRILANAKDMQADLLVTACPLCQYNLTSNTDYDLPVFYFTQLLAYALGLKEMQEVEHGKC